MTTSQSVREFIAGRRLALAGASRSGRKFGNTVLRELTRKGYQVVPVHPEAPSIDGIDCVPDLAAVAGRVDGLVAVVPPEATERLVEEAAAAGIPRIWMQQGAGSPAAVEACRRHGIDVVDGECILMFAEPVQSVHRVHRFVRRLLGRLPS